MSIRITSKQLIVARDDRSKRPMQSKRERVLAATDGMP